MNNQNFIIFTRIWYFKKFILFYIKISQNPSAKRKTGPKGILLSFHKS